MKVRALAMRQALAGAIWMASRSTARGEPPILVVMAGQSNSIGQGTAAFSYNEFQISDAVAGVSLRGQHDQSLSDPIDWISYGPSGAAPRTDATPDFGCELAMARSLEAAAPGRFAIAKFGIGGSGLNANWLDSTGWPSLPALGPTLFDQLVTFILDAMASTGATSVIFVWQQGETDAGSSTPATNYESNLGTFKSQLRTAIGLPSMPFIFTRINNSIVASFKATVRTGQANVDAADADAHVIDTDDLTPLADTFHFTSNQGNTLGRRLADKVLELVAIPNPPMVSWTQTPNGLTVDFSDTSTDDGTISSRSWNFGDGGTSTASAPSRTYAADGEYTVTESVTDNEGAVGVSSRIVRVTSTVVSVDGPAASKVYVPSASAQWSALGITTPTSIYPCQEAAGALVDANAVRNLIVTGTGHLYSQAVTDWSRTFVGFGLSAAGRFVDTTGPDPATNSIALLMYLQLVSSPALSRQVAQISFSPGWIAQVTSAAAGQYRLSANAVTKDGGCNPAGLVMPVLLLHNRAQSLSRMYTLNDRIVGTYQSSVAGRFTAIGNGSSSTAAMRVGLAAEWTGAAAETAFPDDAAVRATMRRLNWNPTW